MARGRKVIAKKSAVVAVRGLAAKGRSATIKRATKETNIEVAVNLDGKGVSNISTGIGFFDHMIDQLARHSLIDITVEAKGDLHIDDHHTVEDCGIALGQAVKQALGDMKGITRYASLYMPMDEALMRVAIDVSGRPFLVFKAKFGRDKVGPGLHMFACLMVAAGTAISSEPLPLRVPRPSDGAISAFSTLSEPQDGQVTSPRFDCLS